MKISLPITFDQWLERRKASEAKSIHELRAEYEELVMKPWREKNPHKVRKKITLS